MKRFNLRTVQKRRAQAKRRSFEHVNGWKGFPAAAVKLSRTLWFAIGVGLGIAANALSIPKGIVEFARNFGDAAAYINDIFYEPSQWTGIFDTFPEGIVDMDDLGIVSSVDVALEIEVVDGNLLDGRIWWSGSCDWGSPYQGLLIEGRISLGGSTADVVVFDFRGGRRTSFFEGELTNDGIIIEFNNFPEQTGLNRSRIARNPEPASLESWSELYCE